jgi:hypothetical protein
MAIVGLPQTDFPRRLLNPPPEPWTYECTGYLQTCFDQGYFRISYGQITYGEEKVIQKVIKVGYRNVVDFFVSLNGGKTVEDYWTGRKAVSENLFKEMHRLLGETNYFMEFCETLQSRRYRQGRKDKLDNLKEFLGETFKEEDDDEGYYQED